MTVLTSVGRGLPRRSGSELNMYWHNAPVLGFQRAPHSWLDACENAIPADDRIACGDPLIEFIAMPLRIYWRTGRVGNVALIATSSLMICARLKGSSGRAEIRSWERYDFKRFGTIFDGTVYLVQAEDINRQMTTFAFSTPQEADGLAYYFKNG